MGKEEKRVRKRKLRTEAVLQSSEDNSDNDTEKKLNKSKKSKKGAKPGQLQIPEDQAVSKKQKKTNDKRPANVTDTKRDHELTKESEQPESKSASFSAFYLRRVTMELEEDLDKIRSAGDFQDSSLPILITALKQGEEIFSSEEKDRIMGVSK